MPTRTLTPILTLTLTLTLGCHGSSLPYPDTHASNHLDTHHGTAVPDPYRWLEDTTSPETRTWIEAQNTLTATYLEAIPSRAALRERLSELWDHPRYSPPTARGDRLFYFKNDGLQDHAVLYVEDESSDPRVLLDPNTLSDDGSVSVARTVPSEDGRYLAWAESVAGSDWRTWRVRDVTSGRDLPDVLRWSKFSGVAWSHDGEGFYYARYQAPRKGEELEASNRGQELYYHSLGDAQADDLLVYARPDRPDWSFGPTVSEDGRYLVIRVGQGSDRRNRVYLRDLEDESDAVTPLLDDFDARYRFLGNDGPVFYFFTDRDAERGRVVAIDTRRPAPEHWRTLVPEGPETLRGVSLLGDTFVTQLLRDAHTVLRVYDLEGAPLGEIALPGIGTAGAPRGRRWDPHAYYGFTAFTQPPSIYRYDVATRESSLFRAPELCLDPADYETRQVFATSPDGTRVPVFLVARVGVLGAGPAPTLLHGYGGFGIAMAPHFAVSRLAWLERGGVYAQAVLRGGGEFGEAWHRAGMLESKQNVFDDFIAVAEHLVAEGVTEPQLLAIEGRSNGGLLVGAVLNQRPDLFGAALPAVGVMDMLRFHGWTIGWAWVSEYGSAEDPEQFETLYAYSPYHNIRDGVAYPPTLVTTADHDDRVVPAHSFKYAARLQAAQNGPAPILIRIETRAGHGAGKTTRMRIEEEADRLAFLLRALGMDGGAAGSPAD